MMESFGIDEFGREHFVVEAARGRLGISLGEDGHGFVVVRCLDVLTPKELEGWEPSDRHRVELLREVLQEGDRLVEIQGEDIVHCSLAEVISRLSKLSAIKRHLTFARYHSTGFDTKKYDVEKLVLARLPRGPLGLQINECIPYGAFIEDFQLLPDGSMSRLAKHPKIHRGCQIINVNGVDVTSMSREEVIAHLSTLRDQDKEVVFYRTARRTCSSIYKVESSASERHLGFTLDENESVRCVVTSVGPRGHSSISPGDVLIGVNSTDISWMGRKESIEFVKDTPLPRQLIFVRLGEQAIPECHQISLASGPLGVNLDGQEPHHAKITGFTTPADADQPAFKSCSSFLPGSFIVSIGKLDVSTHDLASISGMLVKLKNHPKQIVVANTPLLHILAGEAPIQRVKVPKGPLGIHFDSSRAGAAVISGYYKLQDDKVGEVEKTSRIPVGSTLLRINGLNVSCLTLEETLGVLKKLSDKPKELEFYVDDSAQDINTKTVDIRVPPGPLGIDLKSSISNKEATKEEKRDSVTKPIEYMINMSSWTGSRSLYRLLVDPTTRSLQITSAKPSTPKSGKQSASISVAFSEIVSLDCGKGARFSSQSSPSSSRSLFRSSSSTLNTDATDRANVCISLSSSKKSIEFDMRSIDERAAFAQHLHAFLPALVPQS
ncbi:hypothetical protein Poli38472_006659 [Pythium oligandrum]|uniref:PDZ domain-containing protein n=1 Tax=Pythium oligandrum TaxID=41045 RepID=A0A8K1C4Z4_PYTOL|nr:hypothetical protein Poli38472_006659 [Pythium oligandrum]|eukprot:TMW56649.1 hypothetical protein Poli38472_006659 [Pythium oligandrum]